MYQTPPMFVNFKKLHITCKEKLILERLQERSNRMYQIPHPSPCSFLENFIFELLIFLSEFFGQIGGNLKFTFSSFLENTFW